MLRRNLTATLVVAGAAVLAAATSAGATTHRVAGTQVVVDQDAGTFKLRGDLLGDWTVTEFRGIATAPRYRGEGVEVFKGCLDRRRDRSCDGDPTGTLHFTFTYEALYASPDPASLVWGACLHPIERGEGAFAGAQGVLVISDRRTPRGIKTDYVGSVTLAGDGEDRRATASLAAARRVC
jgi:hypothetical protein